MSSLKNYKFDLKSKYERYLKISFILSLIFVIAAFKFSPKSSRTEKINQRESDVIIVKDIEPTRQKEPPPDKPKPVTPIISISDEIDDIIFEDVVLIILKSSQRYPIKRKKE